MRLHDVLTIDPWNIFRCNPDAAWRTLIPVFLVVLEFKANSTPRALNPDVTSFSEPVTTLAMFHVLGKFRVHYTALTGVGQVTCPVYIGLLGLSKNRSVWLS